RRFAARVPGNSAPTLLEDPLFAAKLSATAIEVSALEMYELQALSAHDRGASPGATASVMKIRGTELQQRVTELLLEAAGHYGHAFQPQATRPGGPVLRRHESGPHVGPIEATYAPLRYFNERAGSIYAGSNEIQRNIIAKATLGL